MIQVVKGKSMSGWRGIALIAAIVALLILFGAAARLLAPLIGYTAASIFVWVLGACLALFVMRRFVMGYRYELSGQDLRLGRLYGDRVRFMDQVFLRNVAAWGGEADMKFRFPEAKVTRAVRKDCDIPHLALAIRDAGVRILVIQPDDAMREALEKELKERG